MKFYSQNFSFPILKTFTVIVFTTLALSFSTLQVLAQFTENFSDGELETDPPWTGDVNVFSGATHALQLNAPAVSGSSSIVTASAVVTNTTWTFKVKLSFNPSSTNFTRIYVAADQNDLSSPLNGIFVMIGNTADEISLYKQSGTTKTKIIDGLDGQLNLNEFEVAVRVSCSASHVWELHTDLGSTGTYTLIGSVHELVSFSPVAFGIQCVYTATRSTGFRFDDISVTSTTVDDVPPAIISVAALSANQLEILFSEAVDPAVADTPSNFVVDQGVGSPAQVLVTGQKITLSFSNDFPNGSDCNLTVQGIRDIAGNESATMQKSFLFFESFPASWKDVVVTEIFADPSPPKQLPEAEFVELFNRSNKSFHLHDWTLSDGSTMARLPDFILLPQSYVVITKTSSVSDFAPFGKTIGVSSFPSLNNTDDMLFIRDASGHTIDSLQYSDTWYRHSEKKDGGWSLELIDPENICGEGENWAASTDERGGTPGMKNSVWAQKPDATAPRIVKVIPISVSSIRIVFNEKLDTQLPSLSQFQLSPPIEVASVSTGSARELVLSFSSDLSHGTLYTLTVNSIRDCPGNFSETPDTKSFGLPEEAHNGDLVINEILFNPTSTGVDFVELFNPSKKFIDLSKLTVARIKDDGYTNLVRLSTEMHLLGPGEFVVLTTEPDIVASEYIRSIGKKMLRISLPSLPDDEGSFALINELNVELDRLIYTASMHSPFLNDPEGVSLERVSAALNSAVTDNWASCSKSMGYATPGFVNANSRRTPETLGTVTVHPESFVPRSGEFVQIHYSMDNENQMANVRIFDVQGRVIKTLAQGELLAREGFFRWDGDCDSGAFARTGSYQVWFEIFDRRGVVVTHRKRVAIAAKW